MATLQLDAQPREIVGQKVKRLRREGLVPIIVYGNVDSNVNLQVPARTLERTLSAGGNSQLIQLKVDDGTEHNVLMRDIQRHPVRRNVMHVDFYAINMRETQQVAIPIVAVNQPATLTGGLMVLQPLDTVEIEALPSDIPASIEIDLTSLTIEKALTVADLPAVEGIEYLTSADEPVFTMVESRITEESTAAEAEEGVEGEVEAEEESAADDE